MGETLCHPPHATRYKPAVTAQPQVHSSEHLALPLCTSVTPPHTHHCLLRLNQPSCSLPKSTQTERSSWRPQEPGADSGRLHGKQHRGNGEPRTDGSAHKGPRVIFRCVKAEVISSADRNTHHCPRCQTPPSEPDVPSAVHAKRPHDHLLPPRQQLAQEGSSRDAKSIRWKALGPSLQLPRQAQRRRAPSRCRDLQASA